MDSRQLLVLERLELDLERLPLLEVVLAGVEWACDMWDMSADAGTRIGDSSCGICDHMGAS